MPIDPRFPTLFARRFGEKFGLLETRDSERESEDAQDLMYRMVQFQRMSISSKFDDCISIYYGRNLSEDQIGVLKLIHRTTKQWVVGHVCDVLLSKLRENEFEGEAFEVAVSVLSNFAGERGVPERSAKPAGIVVKRILQERDMV